MKYIGFIRLILLGRSLSSCALLLPVAWRRLYSVKCRALVVSLPNSMASAEDRSKPSKAGALGPPHVLRELGPRENGGAAGQVSQVFLVK
jgi:hypothetical protein